MKEIEVRGIPMRVFESAPPSMRFVWELAAGYGDREYVVYEDERFTYAESDAIIKALAAHLVDDHGVQPGDRVAVSMRNYPGVGLLVLGDRVHRCRMCRYERVVDERGDEVRPVRLAAQGADL